jgi:hypothetical protein
VLASVHSMQGVWGGCLDLRSFLPLHSYHTLLCIGSYAGGAPRHAAPHRPALPVGTAVAVCPHLFVALAVGRLYLVLSGS